MNSLLGTVAFGVAFGIAAFACSKSSEPPPGESAPGSTLTAASSSAPAAASSELKWDVPTTWTVAPNPSPMRKATYKVPRAPGDTEDAEMSVTAAGGGTDANIRRWSGQFQGSPSPEVTTRDVGGLKVTVVEDRGTFSSGMPGGPSTPKTGWMLLGAIVEATSPPTFFKLTGPEKTVTLARPDFDRLVGSLRLK